jgi:predicted transcriptional regulator
MSADANAPLRAVLLKQRRDAHPGEVARAQAMLKEQKRIQDGISALLQEKACTVPDIAVAIGIPPQTVLWHVAAMKKYNLVKENGMDGDYPLYQLAEERTHDSAR